MQTVWKGSISFGLVNIPVRMFAATEDRDIKFRYLHKQCNTPIKYSKVCPTCNFEVGQDDIIKGFEYEPGKFVLINDEDLAGIAPEINKSIEILDFVDMKEIDPIYFAKSYYLSPQETGGKAYSLLKESMDNTGKIGIAKITIRNKQSLAAIRVFQNLLVMETIYFPDEIRPVASVPDIPLNIKLEEKELEMAKHLIENLSTNFVPEKYTDDYRLALKELINKKIVGQEVEVAPKETRANIIDLMEALKASIDQTEPKKTTKETSKVAKPRKRKLS